MSAFWGALAVGAFFSLIFRFALFLQPKPAPPARNPRGGRAKARPGAQPTSTPVKAPPSTAAVFEWLFIAGAVAGASLLAASSTFWSRTAQAKMYSLHFFLLAVLFLLALEARKALDRQDNKHLTRWLVALAATLGLSLTNHLMTVLAVIPIVLLLVAGERPVERLQTVVRRLPMLVPAFLLPLMLYLYMPLRASQSPIMNWGSTDNWGDFWRHVTGWQFREYLADVQGNISRNAGLLSGYAVEQWSFLTLLVVLAALLGAYLLARTSVPIFVSTVALLLITLAFDMVYGISEIEPYAVPMYAVLCVWAGLIPATWVALGRTLPSRAPARTEATGPLRRGWAAAGVVGVLALMSALLVYPKQDYSRNRLAEQFVLNVFSELPEKSIVLTDYWDFYAPTYYVQLIQDVRPDVVLIDKSLLRYPWYSQQLQQRYPWLMEKSRDIAERFTVEQRRWIDGEPFDEQALQAGYLDLMTSFVERNYPEYTPFMLWLEDCPPGAPCEPNAIAPDWQRQPVGLVLRLWPPGTTAQTLPQEPSYDLSGITSDPVSLDMFARANTEMYRRAYLTLADLYSRSGQAEAASRTNERAREVTNALQGR
jgi:uncharacterized membrane protein YfcA